MAARHAARLLTGRPGTCRDLALQVHDIISEMRKYLAAPSLHNALVMGGYDPHGAKAQLQGAHIITGTPGGPEQRLSARPDCARAIVDHAHMLAPA